MHRTHLRPIGGRAIAALLLVLLSSNEALAASALPDRDESWMRVTLEGRKIGHLHTVREAAPDRIISTSTTSFVIDRAGTPLSFESVERHVETPQGKPLAFESATVMAGSSSRTTGRLDASGRLVVEQRNGDAVSTRTVEWPRGAVLSEGARLLEAAAGLAPGTRLAIPTFFGDSLAAATTHLTVIGPERVSVGTRTETLTRVEQAIDIGGARIDGTTWVDLQHRPQRIRLPILGVSMEMVACDRACAQGPNQSSDVLARTLVDAPAGLDRNRLQEPVRYRIELAQSAGNSILIDTAEQRARRLPGVARAWEVTVTPNTSFNSDAAPAAADSRATAWLQSGDADVKRLAFAAVGTARSDAKRMQLLEAGVRSHIQDKNLSIGYASAAETADSREGDCTEHALLLAAMARSVGIPARVVSGLAFAPEYVGRERVFVPHAWTQAWVDGKWRSFDAALRGFDAGHIAFSVGDGDPVGFYHSVSLLGSTRIVEAEPVGASEAKPEMAR